MSRFLFELFLELELALDQLETELDHSMQYRFGALMAVDDLVKGVHDAVEKLGLLDSTYFFYSSVRAMLAPDFVHDRFAVCLTPRVPSGSR